MWLVRRTRAILRSAEFGFLGVMVRTIVQTPRFWGAPRRSSTWRPLSEFHVVRSAGVSTFLPCGLRPLRTSCAMVGTVTPHLFGLTARASTPLAGLRVRGLARETGEPALAGTVPGRSAAAVTRSRLADARNDRPRRGRSPSRKTGRMKSVSGQPPGGQPRSREHEPPFGQQYVRRWLAVHSAARRRRGRAAAREGLPARRDSV